MDAHDLAAERSRALHLAVAERLRAEPALVEVARERVSGWLRDGSVNEWYASGWAGLLRKPIDELVEILGEHSERMHDLRQTSPFAGFIDARTRWRILGEVRRRHETR